MYVLIIGFTSNSNIELTNTHTEIEVESVVGKGTKFTIILFPFTITLQKLQWFLDHNNKT